MKEIYALLGAILGVLLIGCGSIAYLEHVRPDGFNSQAGYAIIGLCTMVLTQLVATIKTWSNSTKLDALNVKSDVAASASTVAAEKASVVADTVQAMPDIVARKIRTGNGS